MPEITNTTLITGIAVASFVGSLSGEVAKYYFNRHIQHRLEKAEEIFKRKE